MGEWFGKATIKELNEGCKPLEFTTPRFGEKITEVISLIKAFLDEKLDPGHIHYINWTTPAPPQKLGTSIAKDQGS